MTKIIRRTSQIFFLGLSIYILWSTAYPLTGNLPPDLFFKLDPFAILITSASGRVLLNGAIYAVGMLVLSLILGRFFCGWICPMGTCIDAVGTFGPENYPRSDSANKKLHSIKIFILGIITAFAILGIQCAWILDPIVIFSRFISLNMIPFAVSGISAIFIFLIRDLGADGTIRDFYHSLKPTILGIKSGYFSHAWIILLSTAAILATSILCRRFWCRTICPLGALYALTTRASLLKRRVTKCSNCKICGKKCRMGAIKDDLSYRQGECVLCMDCVYDCPLHATYFSFLPKKDSGTKPDLHRTPVKGGSRFTRSKFILMAISAMFMAGFKFAGNGEEVKKTAKRSVIRPPASLPEDDFLKMCLRCGNCMKACPTNGLQPCGPDTGYALMWTPRLEPEIGYCEYKCVLCGRTCPTGAIKQVTVSQKLSTKLGTAVINQGLCMAWAEGKECIVCEEHCPVYEKAIKLDPIELDGVIVNRPAIDKKLCVGCGICQNKCPIRPERAIKVFPA